MGHNIMHTIYKIFLYSIQMYIKSSYFFHGSRITVFTFNKNKKTSIKSSYFFHGSRITVLTFTILGIGIKIEKTIIESSYFLHQIKIHQIKLFFHGSRITVLSCTVLRLKSKEIESSYFFTEAVQPVYFRLITENID